MPGDGDFDFMLRHNLPQEIISGLASLVSSNTVGEYALVADGIRAKDVKLPSGEIVDIDITYASKSLDLDYTSDMCVRDRLNSIKENNPEEYSAVVANIIMAKKILKSLGIYKKFGSKDATKYGGFGGIGVENWVLQNNGSFEQAVNSYLEAAEKSKNYEEFIENYPIYDFGKNHRQKDYDSVRYDRFSAFLGKEANGFEYVIEKFKEIQEMIKQS